MYKLAAAAIISFSVGEPLSTARATTSLATADGAQPVHIVSPVPVSQIPGHREGESGGQGTVLASVRESSHQSSRCYYGTSEAQCFD